jgi:hypothetical protein
MSAHDRVVSSNCRACGSTFEYQARGGRRRRFCLGCISAGKRREVIRADNAGKYDISAYRARAAAKRRAAGIPWHAGLASRALVCPFCGASFTTAQRVARFCSRACASRARAVPRTPLDLKLANKQARWHRRRARKAGAPKVERVVLLDIFERDNWTCWICGEAAPKGLRGKIDPMAPTGDHVIPLARGGDHTAENIRCAHARCNIRKRDKLPAEIGLNA